MQFQNSRLPWMLICILAVFSSFACAQPRQLTILHTNDMHAGALPHEALWIRSEPKPLAGGFRELEFMIDSIRKARPNVLLLDAGDVMTGTPIAEFTYRDAVGGALFDMMNRIGYESWTIGNHDFDISQENLRHLTSIAAFPTLSANLVDSAGAFPFNNRQCVVLNKGGLRIGIIGIMSRDLFKLTNTNNLVGVRVLPPIEVAQHLIDSLQPVTDLIVALTHEGTDDDSVLASGTHGLGVIIGGHSHTRLKNPKLVNNVIICQAGSNCENLGQLDLTVDGGKVTAYNGKLLQIWAHPERPATPLSKFIDSLKAIVDKDYGAPIGTLGADLTRSRSGESNIGNFVADAIREGANADIALTNSSGLRKDVHAGKISRQDLFELSPFRNYLCTFPYTGKEVKKLVEWYLQSLVNGRTSIDLSGITCTWKRGDAGPVIVSCTINGKELKDDATYTMATTDFILSQGDKYMNTVPTAVSTSHTTINQALEAKVRKDKTISGILENHFTEAH
jgi:5'-nucleotidase / UDP-sugar diphosphatase